MNRTISNARKQRSALAVAFAFTVAGACSLCAVPAAIEVSAKISVQLFTYAQSGECIGTNTPNVFPVRVVFSRSQWHLETHASKNSIRYYYFDGTNTYSTFEFTKDDDFAESFKRQGKKVPILGIANGRYEGMPSFVTVIPSSNPQEDVGVSAPWMAYCSSHYLDIPERLIPLPSLISIKHSPYAFGYEDKTVRFDDAVRLPKSIRLFSSDKLMRESPHRDLLVRSRQMTEFRAPLITPVPVKEGQLSCEYTVLASTNLNGWNVPLEFSLVVHPYPERGSLHGLEVYGTTESLAETEAVPKFQIQPGTNLVTDFRFREPTRFVDAIAYTVTNVATVPATNDAVAVSAYQRSVGKASIDPVPVLRRKMYALYALCGVLVLGLGSGLVWRLARHKGGVPSQNASEQLKHKKTTTMKTIKKIITNHLGLSVVIWGLAVTTVLAAEGYVCVNDTEFTVCESSSDCSGTCTLLVSPIQLWECVSGSGNCELTQFPGGILGEYYTGDCYSQGGRTGTNRGDCGCNTTSGPEDVIINASCQ